MIAHESLMLHYAESMDVLRAATADLEDQLREDESDDAAGDTREGERARAQVTAPQASLAAPALVARGATGHHAREVTALLRQTPVGVFYKECRRKKARNENGRYEMEVEVEFLSGPETGRRQWLTMEEYEMLWGRGQDVEDDVQSAPGE
jgi:hypothetical protein